MELDMDESGSKPTISSAIQDYDLGMGGTSARTFSLFPELPTEIKLQIIRKLHFFSLE